MSYFKIPREQTNQENCVAHNGNAIPVPGRDILIQSWYQGGTSVIDWTDLGGFWSTYYYNGFIYGSEIQRGFDVFKLSDRRTDPANRVRLPFLNVQTQPDYFSRR